MYVCVCNAVTDTDIRNAVGDGVRSFKQLRNKTACGSGCGCCKEMAEDALHRALLEQRETRRLLPVMQLA